ncbi:hypothetical protein [Novosphingobium rosa]|uniref:hypothetical protein n=1 Tax=Novosphingobium rosa TaxID=76978 RepID=UPI0008331205|nr:hypothetical protein [Novosphingobium rosa]
MRATKFILAIATAASLAAIGTSADAATWGQRHPRQHEVLHREHHQLARINQERREGEISRGQARAMRATTRSIAAQDHADARANGGYITRGQQHRLNAEENAQSRAIGR